MAGAALVAAALLLAACGSSNGGNTTTTAAATSHSSGATAKIVISNFKFVPATITVKPGAKVTVTNKDTVIHTLTSNTAGKFDTGNINADGSGSFTAPMQPGTYGYHCTVHPFMVGTLTVS